MATPWSRAVRTGWRNPAVVIAVAAAAVLVALPATAVALFLSAAGNATLQQQTSLACQWAVGAQWQGGLPMRRSDPTEPEPVGRALYDTRTKLASQALADVPKASHTVTTVLAGASVETATRTPTHPEQTILNLVSRTGFENHLQVVQRGTGPGIWLPDQFAALKNLHAGDLVDVRGGSRNSLAPSGKAAVPDSGVTRQLRVAGIYRDLRSMPDQPYWCSIAGVYRGDPLANVGTYPVALVSPDDFFSLTTPDSGVQNLVESSVDTTGMTTASAPAVVAGLEHVRTRTENPADPLEHAFHRFGSTEYTSSLGGMVTRADQVTAQLATTVVPMGAVGALAGLVIAAAAGSFWVDRRKAELAVLSSRGVGPAALVGKAVLEVGTVVVLGSALGWLAARYLVAELGPSPLVTPGALTGSVIGAAAALLVTLGAIAVASGRRITAMFDAHTTRRRNWPWELLPLGAALVCYFVLGDDPEAGAGAAGSVARIPPRLIVVPLLLVIGLALLAARIVRFTVVRVRPVSLHRAVAFLSWRRLASAPAAAAVLIAATAIPIALSVYATTVTGSVDRTLHAEGQLVVGTDVVVDLTGPAQAPPGFAASFADRYDSAAIGHTTVNVIGVDPATFPDTAFWDNALPGPTLDDLIASLTAPGAPVGVLAGIPGTNGPTNVTINGHTVSFEVTSVAQLPGKSAGFPLMFVRRDVLAGLAGENLHHELWLRGDPDRIIPALSVAHVPVGTLGQAGDVTANGVYAAITYTFLFLTAVSVLAGAIVLVGLLLYLNSRARARRSAYLLLRRMDIGPRAHWRALLYEVGGLLATGFVAGLGFAAIAVAVTSAGYDLDPAAAPGTLISAPWSLTARLAAATLLAAVLATLAAQRAVSRARPSEVLRDTN
ncbi:ABC transporter permease [Amycolatopsis rhabdoformis]|uniref:ABC transporter permease n=1 Tax=Amycolatopsis rhabdoformis TaxID=1448059 RepID=A0ABZ1HVY3_9PSEU|nr:ABC transporter permease [Amycolatopsis rhabdoformis]WSE26368.1 ABC transporter permease [Amycolatopsis rhabdoformis]